MLEYCIKVVDQGFIFKITGSHFETLLEFGQMSVRLRLSGEQWPPLLLYKFLLSSKPLIDSTDNDKEKLGNLGSSENDLDNPQHKFNMSFTNSKLPLIKGMQNKNFFMNTGNISFNDDVRKKIPEKLKD